MQNNLHDGQLCLPGNEHVKAKLAQAADSIVVQPPRHLSIIEQPELANLDVSSSSASRCGPVSGTLTEQPTTARRKGNRVLVVKDQVVASNLFNHEGYEVEKQSECEALGMTSPRGTNRTPPKQFASVMRTIALCFRTAVFIGMISISISPKTNMWRKEHNGKPSCDNICKEMRTQCCHKENFSQCSDNNALLTLENTSPCATRYTMLSTIDFESVMSPTIDIPSHLSRCRSKTHTITQRPGVDTNMSFPTWNRIKGSKGVNDVIKR